MTDAPERIWACGYNEEWVWGAWDLSNDGMGDVEYIRADLIPQWQPIETAPKDSIPILVWDEYYLMRIAIFDEKFNGFHTDAPCVEDVDRLMLNPTYWMPLPELPTT